MSEPAELVVGLTRAGDMLQVKYTSKGKDLGQTRRPWTDFDTYLTYSKTNRSGIDGLNDLLDGEETQNGLNHHLTGDAGHRIGALLFDVLFPDKPLLKLVLDEIFQPYGVPGSKPSPLRYPVRVRIHHTTESPLVGLPWRMTTWEKHYLTDGKMGWTFEEISPAEPRDAGPLSLPAKVLIIAPIYSGPDSTGGSEHIDEVCSALGGRYRDRISWVHTGAELEQAFSQAQPDVVYYFGHVALDAEGACLAFDRTNKATWVSSSHLARLLGKTPPHLVFINGCRGSADGWRSFGHQLGPHVSMVVACRTVVSAAYSRQFGTRLLVSCLLHGHSPLSLLHTLPPGESRRDFHWSAHTIHSSAGEWTTTGATPEPIEKVLKLDRDEPRGTVDRNVHDLVKSDKQRVLVILVPAAPGNLVGEFFGQAYHDVGEHYAKELKQARNPGALGLPDDCSQLHEQLDPFLRATLKLPANLQPRLADALRGVVPWRPGDALAPVLWLNFGVFAYQSGRPGQPALTDEDLDCWLDAWSTLAGQLKDESRFRIVAYLAMEDPDPDALDRRFEEATTDERFARDELRILPVRHLEGLKKFHIVNYLRDHTDCPPGIRTKLAELLIAAFLGEYEATVNALRMAHRIGWLALSNQLKDRQLKDPRKK